MDKQASSTIIQGTFITSAVSAFATGIFGIATKNANYGFLAGAAAINSGVTAVTFFGIREFGVSPLLVSTLPWPQYSRRRRELGLHSRVDDGINALEQASWSDLRRNKTLDSGLSGIATGGILRGWKSGPRAVLPGALTAGAICTLLQMAYNELGVMRLRYLSNNGTSTPTPLPSSSSIQSSHEPPRSFTEQVLTMLGLKPVSDEEYLAKIKKTRESYLKRIDELERQLEAEKVDKVP